VSQWQSLVKGLEHVTRWQCGWEAFPVAAELAVAPDVLDRVLLRLAERLQDNYPFHHPVYAGQMLKPPHPVAMMAYAMTMLINPNNHAADGGPATARLEREVVEKLAGMLGLPRHLGHLCASGTIANLEALWVSRRLHPHRRLAHSEQAHYTHGRIGEVVGLQTVAIATDEKGRLSVAALDAAHRESPIGTVVATMGTTGVGAVDPLSAIVEWARTNGVRVHVDAAYGGFYALLAQDSSLGLSRSDWEAIAQVDSVVIDPHKHGLQPYGCGCVLFADPEVGRLYRHDSPYTYFTNAELHLGEISLECSRPGAAAAALWATFEALPLQVDAGFGPVLRACRLAALDWAERLLRSQRLRLLMPPELDIVCFFPVGAGLNVSAISYESDAVFQALMGDACEPIYLAKLKLPQAVVGALHPDLVWDQPELTVLRSCLMKPEHRDIVPYLHARVERLSGAPGDWDGGFAAPSSVPVRAMTAPFNVRAQWLDVLARRFGALTETLVNALRTLFETGFAPGVATLAFELSHPYGLAGAVGLRVYTLGTDGWLYCAERSGEAVVGFSGSVELLEGHGPIIPEEVVHSPRFVALHESVEDIYELSAKFFFDWFIAAFKRAGGDGLALQSHIGVAGDEEVFDLATEEWVLLEEWGLQHPL